MSINTNKNKNISVSGHTIIRLKALAKKKENTRSKLVVTAKNLAKLAKKKENIKYKLVVKAKKLKLKARNLATFAQEKESVRGKLVVTAKKLNESYEVLEQAKAKDEAMLASIGDAVIACDKKGKIILFNVVAEILTGFSAKDAIGHHYSQILKFIREKGKNPVNDFIAEAIKTGRKTKTESHIFLIKKDGDKIPVADSAAPIKNTQNNILGCVVVFRDTTLEREVVKMKDDFLSLASHELRTPMTSIAGFVDMILEGRYGQIAKEIREPLGYVAESTDRLIRLVNDLLNVSRIEAGRMEFTLGQFDIGGIVSKVVTSLQPIAEKRNLKLTFNPKDSVQVQVDIEKVEQILHNLIGNALKFTDKGNVSIIIKKNNDSGVIEITDTGVGVPGLEQKRLFGKFEQISTDPAGRQPGTGLGLYLSLQMARKMGGNIKLIKSTLGKGSVFEVSFPIAGSALSKSVIAKIKAK